MSETKTNFAITTPEYVYGFDPAHGNDCAVRVKFERLPDGAMKMIDTQHWDEQKNKWVSHVG